MIHVKLAINKQPYTNSLQI